MANLFRDGRDDTYSVALPRHNTLMKSAGAKIIGASI
jgi:hypothetical protein